MTQSHLKNSSLNHVYSKEIKGGGGGGDNIGKSQLQVVLLSGIKSNYESFYDYERFSAMSFILAINTEPLTESTNL